MSGGTQQKQEIPTHLEVEDRLVFGLTLRQGIVVLVGLSIGYFIYAQLGNLPWPADGTAASGAVGHPPVALRVAAALLPALCSLALAVIQPAGRPLEEWLFALARYAALPKRCVWRPRPSPIADEQLSNEGVSDLDVHALESEEAEGRNVPLVVLRREGQGDRPEQVWEGAGEP